MSRPLIIILILLGPAVWAVADESPDTASTNGQPATPEQISEWIADLNGPRFIVRENATKALLEAGGPAVGSLGKVAAGDDPEAAERAIWILRNLADRKRKQWTADSSRPPVENGSTPPAEAPNPPAEEPVGDPTVRQAALEQLVKLKTRPTLVAWAAEGLVTELGGQCLPEGVDPQLGRPLPNRVVIGASWRGGDAALAYVATVSNHQLVQFIGTDVTADGVRQLKSMKDLQYIELYGTRISEEDKNKLVADFPNVTIDYRRGALLGVTGSGEGRAAIQGVQPGSAAAVAGLHPGDVVLSFNGKPIANFQELTDNIAKFQPGDEATLEILRGEQQLTKTVKFGSW